MTSPKLSLETPNGRYYYDPARRGVQVPSITNIKDKKNIPGLKFWAARQAAQYAADNLTRLAALTPGEIYQLVKGAPFSKDSDRAKATATGDLVHSWIDNSIKGNPPTDEEVHAASITARHMWQQFLFFQKRYNPQWVCSEFTVWSERYGYAGTGDWGAWISKALVLGDTKTGNKLYPDMGMQLAALKNADYILMPDGTQQAMPPFSRCALLHVRPTFTRLVPVDHVDECFRAFLALKVVFDIDVQCGNQILVAAPKIQASTAAKEAA